jgi:chromosome segregation ATPase
MFQRFRQSRRSHKSKYSKVEGDRNKVFRHKKNDAGRPPVLNPTFSVDSEADSVSTASHSAFEMDNDLCSHAGIPAIIETERSQQKRQLEELMEAHAEEIADKDEEIVRCTNLLQETESKLAEVLDATHKRDETITDLQQKLFETEAIMYSTQAELCESKANLQLISSELIQTQHILHEQEQQLNIFAELGKDIYHYFSAAA